jgi:aquaporin NIP
MRDSQAIKQLTAEFFGTFGLVFAGTGAIIIDTQSRGAITHLGVAVTFGLIVMSMIYTIGDVSGAHINPAVSTAFAVAGRIEWKRLPGYVLAQVAGAVCASAMLRFLFPLDATLGATIPAGSNVQSFVLEMVLTFFLMLVILSVSTGAKEKGITAGIAIGATVGLEALFAGPICGASMNPARSLAPALVSGHLNSLWLYLIAPIAGAVLAVPICCLLQHPECCAAVKPAPPSQTSRVPCQTNVKQ